MVRRPPISTRTDTLFPYTTLFRSQADALKDAHVVLDFVLEISVPEENIIERMSGRRMHPPSGRSYHVKFNPHKNPGLDDLTGEPLVQRDDDRKETVKHRLDVYREQTRPLVDYYSNWASSGEPAAPTYRRLSGQGTDEETKTPHFQ